MFHRGPQPVLVKPEDVELGLLARPARHDRPALLVHVEHEPGGLRLRVAEELLEDVGHVGHQVDGVVPDHDDPRAVGHDLLTAHRFPDLGGQETDRWLETTHPYQARAYAGTPASPAAPGAEVTAGPRRTSPRLKRSAATQTAVAPAMWMATSSAGTPVKYCV